MSRRDKLLRALGKRISRRDSDILAKVTARVTKGQHPQTLLSDMFWSESDRAVLAARKQAPLVFNQIGPA